MKKSSNTYIFIYSVLMVVIVGAVLSFVAITLKPRQDRNIENEKKRNILTALQIQSTTDNVEKLFEDYIVDIIAVNNKGDVIPDADAFVINLKKELEKSPNEMYLPIFIGQLPNGDKKYIVPLAGKGLWGPIWGYLSFDEDMNTIFGATFSHKAETPGLGAEIETAWYQEKFLGKEIFTPQNEFVSIDIVKGGAASDNNHGVDAISGGTITSYALKDMIYDCLKLYEPYLNNQKN